MFLYNYSIIDEVMLIVTVFSGIEGNDILAKNLLEHMVDRLKRKQPNINVFNDLPFRFGQTNKINEYS